MTRMGWHEIWTRAIRANQDLALGRSKGKRKFEKLLEDYPHDVMIYYERGEAFEYLGEFDSAQRDYRIAEECFPLNRWKDLAHEGLDRVCNRNPLSSLPMDTLGSISHRIHSVPRIPHFVRVDALLGLARFYSHPYLSAAMSRIALERLVVELLERRNVEYSEERETLCHWINLLYANSVISKTARDDMHCVRDLGNKGIHVRDIERAYDCNFFKPSLLAFVAVLESIDTRFLMSL